MRWVALLPDGWWIDGRLPAFLVALPLLSAFALLCISATTNAQATMLLLGIVGFAYGSIIAIYPVAISNGFGEQGPQAYGRVFIAWGFAGLVAPWSAGVIFDGYAGYEPAMLIAALVALVRPSVPDYSASVKSLRAARTSCWK